MKNHLKDLVDKMFEISGHPLRYEDVQGRTDNWYQQYTMTEEQNREWRDWCIKHLKKVRKWNKHLAEREMAMLDLYIGLKIENK
jgi:hypothetical protein